MQTACHRPGTLRSGRLDARIRHGPCLKIRSVPDLATLPTALVTALFAGCVLGVWFAGVRLSHDADALAERTGAGHALMGFVLLATATQLPEVATNVTGALRGQAQLVLNSMVGGITMQTAVLALADGALAGVAITRLVRSPLNQLQGALLIALLALLLVVIELGDARLLGWVGIGPVVLLLGYGACLAFLWHARRDPRWKVIDEGAQLSTTAEEGAAAPEARHPRVPLRRLWARVGLCSAVILLCGVGLMVSAEVLAARSGLGSSFMGVTLVASATSLPELSTSIAAVRLGAPTMAISDVLGSNMIMVLLLLPVDALYSEGPLLATAGVSVRLALVFGMGLTAILLTGLVLRPRRTWLRLGPDSWALLALYAASLVSLFSVR